MHIPDGFIDLKTAVTTGVISAGGLAGAIYGVKKYFKARVIAMMGVMSALIFALQMINFTIPGGTSGHLLGGALAAIIAFLLTFIIMPASLKIIEITKLI